MQLGSPAVLRDAHLRRRSVTAAACAVLAVLVALVPVTGARATSGWSNVGGPDLATRGVAVHPAAGVPALPKPAASAYVVADLDTGQVLAAKDPHGYYAPASTLKILTALTFIPRLDPNATMRVTYGDAAVDGTKVGIVPGASYQIRDLFRAMLIMSANDAACAIATAAGGRRKALAAMNAEATQMQAYDTRAETPNGLDHPGQHSSAYDLALLARAALRMPDFRQYVATRTVHFPAPHHKGYPIYTHDDLLLHYRGAFGVKNGYTVAAQASFVGAAERHGRRLVAVVMHADPLAWMDVAHLLTWGFHADGVVTPVGTLVDPIPVPAATPTAGVAAQHVSAASALPVGRHGGLRVPTAPLVAVGAIAVVFATFRVRSRSRRRWRYRSRYSLPKL